MSKKSAFHGLKYNPYNLKKNPQNPNIKYIVRKIDRCMDYTFDKQINSQIDTHRKR